MIKTTGNKSFLSGAPTSSVSSNSLDDKQPRVNITGPTDSGGPGGDAAMRNEFSPPQNAPSVSYEKVYVKDLSVEVPNGPHIFMQLSEAPQNETQLNITASNFSPGYYELVITSTVRTLLKNRIVFSVEVAQAGIFQVLNVPAEHIDSLMGVHCCQFLYPYLRATVADVVTRAGFPPLYLPFISFDAFYAQKKKELEASGQLGPMVLQTSPAP